MKLLTCHTDGCENADIPIPLAYPDDSAPPACGVCGQVITDITEPPEPVGEASQ